MPVPRRDTERKAEREKESACVNSGEGFCACSDMKMSPFLQIPRKNMTEMRYMTYFKIFSGDYLKSICYVITSYLRRILELCKTYIGIKTPAYE